MTLNTIEITKEIKELQEKAEKFDRKEISLILKRESEDWKQCEGER